MLRGVSPVVTELAMDLGALLGYNVSGEHGLEETPRDGSSGTRRMLRAVSATHGEHPPGASSDGPDHDGPTVLVECVVDLCHVVGGPGVLTT